LGDKTIFIACDWAKRVTVRISLPSIALIIASILIIIPIATVTVIIPEWGIGNDIYNDGNRRDNFKLGKIAASTPSTPLFKVNLPENEKNKSK
jgi:hypothetical protein